MMKPVRYVVFDIETKYKKNLSKTIQKEIEGRANNLLTFAPHLTKEVALARTQLLNPSYSELMSFTYMMLDESFTPILRGANYFIFCDDYSSEEDMIRHILSTMSDLQESYVVTYVGYNSLNFDSRYCFVKAMYHQMPVDICKLGMFDFTRYKVHPQFDMSQWLANWQPANLLPLSTIARDFKIASKIKTDMINAEGRFLLQDFYAEGNIEKVVEYAEEDVSIEAQIFRKIAPYYL